MDSLDEGEKEKALEKKKKINDLVVSSYLDRRLEEGMGMHLVGRLQVVHQRGEHQLEEHRLGEELHQQQLDQQEEEQT